MKHSDYNNSPDYNSTHNNGHNSGHNDDHSSSHDNDHDHQHSHHHDQYNRRDHDDGKHEAPPDDTAARGDVAGSSRSGQESAAARDRDIFDRIMSWKIFSPLRPFYEKYREPLLYLFFGGLTTVLNIICFALLTRAMPPLVANVIAWVIAVIFAYITNRTWVFRSTAESFSDICRELLSFTTGRLATLGMEELILWVGIDLLHFNTLVVKIIAQVLVVIGNYVISKLFVFKDRSQSA